MATKLQWQLKYQNNELKLVFVMKKKQKKFHYVMNENKSFF